MSEITINNKNPLFEGLEDKIYAARYHSLIIDDETFPEDLKVIGRDEKDRSWQYVIKNMQSMEFSSIQNRS